MNTRQQLQQDVARSGQGRRAGTVFAGSSGNGAEPILGNLENCNESKSVYGWPVRGQQRNTGFQRHQERQPGPVIRRRWAVCNDLRANARRSLPQVHHGAFREGFNGANAGADRITRQDDLAHNCCAGPEIAKPEISTGRSTFFNAAARNCASAMAGLSGIGDLGLAESTPANTDAAAPYSDAGAFAGARLPAFFSATVSPSIVTLNPSISISCRRRSSSGSARNSRARFLRLASSRFSRAFAKSATPGGSFRFFISLVHGSNFCCLPVSESIRNFRSISYAV